MENGYTQFDIDTVRDRAVNIKENLEKANGKENLNNEQKSKHEHLEKIMEMVIARIDSAPIQWASDQVYKNLNSNLSSIENQIKNYSQNGNGIHLNSIDNHVKHILQEIQNLPKAETPEEIESIGEEVRSFRSSMSQQLRRFKEEVKEKEADLEEARETIDEKLDDIDQIENKVNKKANELKKNVENKFQPIKDEAQKVLDEVNNQKGRLDTAISEFQSQFSDAQEKRRNDFSELLQKISEDNKQEFEAEKEKTKKELKLIEDSSKQKMNKIEEYKQDAKKVVGAISEKGITGGFKERGNYERKQADFWRSVAVISIIGIVAISGVLFWNVQSAEKMVWELLAGNLMGKGIFIAALGVLSGYSIKESKSHRKRQRRYETQELELAAISPYLATLNEEKQQEIKELMVDKFFGSNREIEQKTIEEVNQPIFDFVTKLVEKLIKRN